jgi:hypothetical protein
MALQIVTRAVRTSSGGKEALVGRLQRIEEIDAETMARWGPITPDYYTIDLPRESVVFVDDSE